MLGFCCWKHHQRAFQGCKAQMDFTSLCTSPEPKLNSQVKLTPQHRGRCPGCMSVPHPGCSSGSQEKWRSPQKSGFGEIFAKNNNNFFKKKKVQRTAVLLHWEFNEALAFRLKIHITAIPFLGPLELFPL